MKVRLHQTGVHFKAIPAPIAWANDVAILSKKNSKFNIHIKFK
jgi:hypothetical protein